jgi:hypothetical protein
MHMMDPLTATMVYRLVLVGGKDGDWHKSLEFSSNTTRHDLAQILRELADTMDTQED